MVGGCGLEWVLGFFGRGSSAHQLVDVAAHGTPGAEQVDGDLGSSVTAASPSSRFALCKLRGIDKSQREGGGIVCGHVADIKIARLVVCELILLMEGTMLLAKHQCFSGSSLSGN